MSLTIPAVRHRFCLALGATLTLLAFTVGLPNSVVAGEPPAKVVSFAEISGKILDGAKSPVDQAHVTLYRWESPNRRWGRWKVVGDAFTTDKSGVYRFAKLPDDYFMVAVVAEKFARAFRDIRIGEHQSQSADIILDAPVERQIRVEDERGQPIVGARVREYRLRGANGETRFPQLSIDSLGIATSSSDKNGYLRLPQLPAGDVINKIIIDHADFAPAFISELPGDAGAMTKVTMRPGVPVTLRLPIDQMSERINGAVIDLRFEPFNDPSTVLYYEAKFDAHGEARLTLGRGKYTWLLLQHSDFFLTPAYAAIESKDQWLRIEPGRNQNLSFELHRKVSVSGRIVDADTGKPLSGLSVMGQLANGTASGWDDAPPEKWSFAGWGESDQDGKYKIELAAGSVRITFEGNQYLAEKDFYDLSIAADGSTVIPDIKVRTLPKVVGIVQNPDGSPAVGAVVRLRGKFMAGLQPVLTDAKGRFEIQPNYVPLNEDTKERLFVHPIVAFDPHRPLAALAETHLDQSEDVVLKLAHQEPGWPLTAIPDELNDWERGNIEPELAAKYAAISLHNHPAPELDAALWLNTGDKPLGLAELRGKFVLLDFWFVGCGPCHGDFPSVKLVHELYKSKGVVVIGVHNNFNTPEAVREHVAKIGLPFPVAVDHPDGRTVARFEPHGIPESYPDYVLISPEGKVLLDDRTIPHPSLRRYKLEIIRKFLLEQQAAK
jgi:thiol-disulfide isomerase/thioredoxin